ncbi:MAG: pyruvate kinase [Nitrososphaerota archaeon]|nr:pyruvate kinase [Nitrososphaerota archaeon]
MAKTKIAVTIGAASKTKEVVRAMALSGATIFRINFSHGSPEEWGEVVDIVREVEKELGKYFALIGDLRGPSVRLGDLEDPINIKAGEEIKLVLAPESCKSEKLIPLPNPVAFKALRKGHVILMDDGRAAFRVESVSASEIVLKALTDAHITSRKTVVIQGSGLDMPAISDQEVKAIKFAVENGFDYIGLSYVRGEEDISMLRGIFLSLGAERTSIIAKIETPIAVKRLREIVATADAVLVARGDLGMHFPLEEIPELQRKITSLCVEYGKPVIVATQLLGSMIENPVPTRSELVDVVSALTEGVDALMLTGETAVGKYPVEAVKWLSKIIERYEPTITLPKRGIKPENHIADRFAAGIVSMAESLNAVIAVYTRSGKTAERIASFKPTCRVISASHDEVTLRKLALIRGIETLKVSAQSYEEGLEELERKVREAHDIPENSIVILTYGMRGEPVHIVKIVQLRKSED